MPVMVVIRGTQEKDFGDIPSKGLHFDSDQQFLYSATQLFPFQCMDHMQHIFLQKIVNDSQGILIGCGIKIQCAT